MNELKTPMDYAIKARMMGKKTISYSQISKFDNCPLSWKLEKIDRKGRIEPNIFLIFGTAFHETLQEYLRVVYETTAVAADKLDLHKLLKDNMSKEFNVWKDKKEGDTTFTSQADMKEFYSDGIAILDWIKARRSLYFAKKDTELVGIEMPIFHNIEYNKNIMFMGFMDLVLKVGNTIKIIDIKTSYMGWKPKKQKLEGSQLRLYKKFFSEQYDVDIKNIEIEYFIVKRKIWEESEFPQKRVQIYKPASGKPSINKADKKMKEFVDFAFDKNGKINKDKEYLPYKTNCTYCQFKNQPELCPPHKRLVR